MMSLQRSMLCALLFSMAACGSDERAVDVRTFFPKPPVAAPVARASEVVATPAPLAIATFVAPTKFDDAMVQGKALVEQGDAANAKLMFEAAIKLAKKRSEPHIELAKLYISSGDRGLAMAAANKAVKLAPQSSQAWNTKGRAELNRFAYDDAIEAFAKAVEINKDNVWAWNNLGYTELQLQKYAEAAEHLGEAVTKTGATGYMFNNLGTALEHLDRLDEARTAFEGGAKLGSKESASSRKRLDGVASIAIIEKATKPDMRPDTKQTYDNNEGPTEPDAKIEDPAIETAAPDPVNTAAPLTAPAQASAAQAAPAAPAPEADLPADAGIPTT